MEGIFHVKSFQAVQHHLFILLIINKEEYKNIYTHVLQQKLKSVMIELINFFFGDGDKEVIGIAKYGAIWTNKQQKHRLFLSKHRQPNVFHVKLSFVLSLKEVAS